MDKGKTSTKTTKTYTEAEARNMISDALAEQGRKHKTAIDRLQGQLEELERSGVDMNDPKQKSSWELKQELKKKDQRIEDLEEENAGLKLKADRVDEIERRDSAMVQAKEVAAGYEGLDPQELIDFTGGSREQMEAYAKKHGKPKSGGKGEGEGEGGSGDEDNPDTGATHGGLTGEKLLENANNRFNKGEINEKQYKDLVAEAAR